MSGSSARTRHFCTRLDAAMLQRLGVAAVAAAVAAGAGYRLVVRGALTLDTGIGRRVQSLGPLVVTMAAPRELVYDVLAAPYLGRTPRALGDEIDVLERGADLVLAAHRTPVGRRLVATTVETVRFERPDRIAFRLLRGPVPHVVETFQLEDAGGATRLVYEGELGTDFWGVGAWWGDQVARKWVATVEDSLARVRAEAERRAGSHRR